VEAVHDGRALHGGTAGDGIVPSGIGTAIASCRLGDVQRNGERRSSQLLGKVGETARKVDGRGESEELDCTPIDVKAYRPKRREVASQGGESFTSPSPSKDHVDDHDNVNHHVMGRSLE
jgi:hypothetical protein